MLSSSAAEAPVPLVPRCTEATSRVRPSRTGSRITSASTTTPVTGPRPPPAPGPRVCPGTAFFVHRTDRRRSPSAAGSVGAPVLGLRLLRVPSPRPTASTTSTSTAGSSASIATEPELGSAPSGCVPNSSWSYGTYTEGHDEPRRDASTAATSQPRSQSPPHAACTCRADREDEDELGEAIVANAIVCAASGSLRPTTYAEVAARPTAMPIRARANAAAEAVPCRAAPLHDVPEAGSRESATAGRPSVSRLTVRTCTTVIGAPGRRESPIAKRTTSPRLAERRKATKFACSCRSAVPPDRRTMVEKSSSVSTTSAASRAASVPLPHRDADVARRRAGVSLIPSPVTATT